MLNFIYIGNTPMATREVSVKPGMMYRLSSCGLRAIFVSDIVYTSCNVDLIHNCLRISIASFKHRV